MSILPDGDDPQRHGLRVYHLIYLLGVINKDFFLRLRHGMKQTWRTVWVILFPAIALGADGPADNVIDKVRPVPPPGIQVPTADHQQLAQGVDQLGKAIAELRAALKSKATLLELLPDVQIYHNAVRYALTYNEFFNPKEIVIAKTLLDQGLE